MFDSLFNLTKDIVKIVTTPIEVTVDLTRVLTKPIADIAEDVTSSVKEMINDE